MAAPDNLNAIAIGGGITFIGCGKMGSAILAGLLDRGLPAKAVWVRDPAPSDWLKKSGVAVNAEPPSAPKIVVLAIKPQIMGDVLPQLQPFAAAGALIVSIAAGIPLATLEAALGAQTPLVRAMPNMPASVGKGITALVANAAGQRHLGLARAMLSVVGKVVEVRHEAQMDAITALSGSGPAYVFHLIEAMATAGICEGLAPDLSMALARATVIGAAALADQTDETAAQLRESVTSPNGTTEAALDVLMAPQGGLASLMQKAIRAAAARSEALSDG